MAKFNSTVVVAIDGKELYFITKGRSKPFTMEEINDYCKQNDIWLAKDIVDPEDWEPNNPKIFLSDLRYGPEHCVSKYGVSEKTIEKYIAKKLPHLNLKTYGDRDG